MKKMVLLTLIFFNVMVGSAQYYENLYVGIGTPSVENYCDNENLMGFIVHGELNCENHWFVYGEVFHNDTVINTYSYEYEDLDSIIIQNHHRRETIDVEYISQNIDSEAKLIIIRTKPENPFIEPIVWKRKGELLTLNSNHVNAQWSTGETTQSIVVSEPGTYSVTLTNDYCGSATYSVEVRNNVELYRATCDLLTNKNKMTWLTTPEQAEYVSAVKVYRNNVLVATVPYTDGSFTDDIGSDATQWQYHLVAVSVEGDDCPIPSYWKRTIHLDRIQDSQGNLILQWTPYEEEEPDKETVSAYGIYDIVGGEAHHVVDVGYFTNVYTYNPADFSGYGAVAAVFNNSKGLEDLAFSNRTIEMLLVDENLTGKMVVYPNPTNGEFTVEGVKDLTVFNTLGQTIATSHSENGTHRITVSSGIYFIKSDEGMVRKVVVE